MRGSLNGALRQNLAGALLLFVLVTLAFAPFAYGDRSLMASASDAASIYDMGGAPYRDVAWKSFKGLDPGAAAWQTEPEFFLEHNLIAGEHVVPLWNPYSGFGQPLAANMLSQPFYPLTWLIDLHPSARMYNWFILLRLYVAALFTFLYLRYFVRFTAAVAGGVAFSFTGYLILYINIAHLSVECWIPAIIWAMETLVRRRSAGAVVTLAVVLAIAVFGGMPESVLLAFLFAYAYFAVRIVTDRNQRPSWAGALGRLAVASALGAGLSACLLLPFIEFVKLATDQHRAGNIGGTIMGLVNDGYQSAYLGPYLVPLIFGPPWSNVLADFSGWSTVRGWFGITQFYFAVVAIADTVILFVRRRQFTWTPAVFFTVVSAFVLLKRFGNVSVNWVGALPGLSLEEFAKYDEPILGFCVACLAAIGIEHLAARSLRPKAGWCAAVITLALLTSFAGFDKAAFLALTQHAEWHPGSLLLALIVLSIVSVLGWLSLRLRTQEGVGRLAAVAVAILYAEALASFIIPVWYIENPEPLLSRAPIYGAPYVDFLRARATADHLRFYGEDSLLYPEWSSVFGISDVRDLNALYDEHYLKFVRAFLPSGPGVETNDRFTGVRSLDFQTPLQQRFLQLSSVGYLGSTRSVGADASLLTQALAADPADVGLTLREGTFGIGGSTRIGVFMHAPRVRYPVPVALPRDVTTLRFGFGLDANVWADPATICGDGVHFVVEVRDAGGTVTPLFSRYIDPKHRAAERHWFDVSVPMRHWAGQRVALLFSTLPGPSGTNCDDWAVWSRVAYDTPAKKAVKSPFERVYVSPNALIYRYRDALPRLAGYSAVVSAPTDDQALARLTSPNFDPRRTAVVTAGTPTVRDALAAFRSTPGMVIAGRLDAYTSQRVAGSIDLPNAALVVLNDTDYPGWLAYVDGREAAVVRANYLFRGVFVPAGHHSIEFVYRPASFRIGLTITLASVLAAVILLMVGRLRRKRRGAGEEPA